MKEERLGKDDQDLQKIENNTMFQKEEEESTKSEHESQHGR